MPVPFRWFHGACARVKQDQVDAMGDDNSWDCNGCKAYKKQQERELARSQR
jgi:hypothetical protein